MAEQQSAGRELAKGAGWLAAHVVAIVVGLILMIAGMAMGVTVVLLPLGVPVGLAGLFILLWGFVGAPGSKEALTPSPGPRGRQGG
jgi:hypothetical protein